MDDPRALIDAFLKLPALSIAGLCALGGFLLTVALRGKRIDYDPHCRKCQYNLTGVTSERCPECGARLTRRSVTRGLRQRRRAVLVVGCLAVAAASYLGYQRIPLIRYLPYRSVLQLAKKDSDGAIRELNRRFVSQQLSFVQVKDLVEACLVMQETSPRRRNLRRWMHLLGRLEHSQALSTMQQERYYAGIVGEINIQSRGRIREGEPLLVTVTYAGGSPYTSMFVKATHVALASGGQTSHANPENFDSLVETSFSAKSPPLAIAPGPFSEAVLGSYERINFEYLRSEASSGGWAVFCCVLAGPPCQRQIELSADVALFRSSQDEGPFWQKTVDVSHTVEVVGPETKEDVAVVTDDAFADHLKRIIRPYHRMHKDGYVEISFDLAGRPRISVAFEVLARSRGQERKAGYWYCWKGARAGLGSARVGLDHVDPDDLTVVLRSDKTVAQKTVDLEKIWDGELVLRPVPLRCR